MEYSRDWHAGFRLGCLGINGSLSGKTLCHTWKISRRSTLLLCKFSSFHSLVHIFKLFSISFLYPYSHWLETISTVMLNSSINQVIHPILSVLLLPLSLFIAWLPLLPNIGLPIMWAYLICNMFTQYFCIRSVFILTTECSSLIVTLVITLRKFISLIFSIIYFQNEFTVYHWIGTTAVFLGTFLFSNIHRDILRVFRTEKREHVE